ncbi:LuxR C-terminal-related transcriptional regulator [Blastococcus sp. SYSU D00695]
MSDRSWPVLPRPALAGAVAAALRAPTGAGVVVSGEPGIGKTTLLAQALAGAAPALSVRGSALVAEVPYGALHAHLTDLDGDVPESPLAVSRVLGRALRGSAGGGRPVVLVDNSALVDPLSAHVLAGLAESGAAVLAVTAVDLVDMPAAFGELWRDDVLTAVAVPALTAEETGDLVRGHLDGPVAAATLRHLAELSEGNPLLLRYLVEDAVGSGGLVQTEGVWALTGGHRPADGRLAQLIGTRLGRWSAAEREGLELVALTDRLPLRVLLSLVDPAALERLERSGVVVVDGEPEPSARIANRLVADVVRRGVPFTRRRALREQVLAAGADLTGGSPRQLLSYALWTLDSGAVLDPAVALRAARAAGALFDPELALRLAGAVTGEELAAEAAAVRAQSLRRMGLAAQAGQVAAAALEGARDPDTRALLAAEAASSLAWVAGGPERGLALLAEVRATLPPGHAAAPAGAELALRAARGEAASLVEPLTALHVAGPPGPRRPVGAPTPDLLRARDGGAWLVASALLADVLVAVGRQRDAEPVVAATAAGLAEPGIDAEQRTGAALALARALAGLGRVDDAVALLSGGPGGAEALVLGGAVEAVQGLLLARAGRIDAARGHLLSALGQARRRDPLVSTGAALAGLALCAARAGDAATARAHLAEHGAERYAPHAAAVTARACLLEASVLVGDGGLRELVELGAAELAAGRPGDGVQVLWSAARLGSPDAVALLTATPLPQPGPLATAVAGHATGLATGDPAVLLRAAEALLDLGCPGGAADAATAVTALPGVGRDTTRAAQRVLTAVRRAAGAPRGPGRAATGDGLTPREQDVASRAAARLSNAEIARELHLSVRTVESYLQSAFGKLGVSSRLELRDVLAAAS